MTAIFRPDGPLFRATEQAGGALVAGDAAGKRDHGAGGAGLTMASLSDRKGAFAEVLQAMTFERRAAQAEASWAAKLANKELATDVRFGTHQARLATGPALVNHLRTLDYRWRVHARVKEALPVPELTRGTDVKLN